MTEEIKKDIKYYDQATWYRSHTDNLIRANFEKGELSEENFLFWESCREQPRKKHQESIKQYPNIKSV